MSAVSATLTQKNSRAKATNVATDFVRIRGESRSTTPKFVGEITAAYKDAFKDAVQKVKDHEGKTGKVKFIAPRLSFFSAKRRNASREACRRRGTEHWGLEPKCKTTNGGLDANWIVEKHGIPTITFGAGQNEIHTVKEWVDLWN